MWQYIILALPMTAVAAAGGLPQLMQVPRIVHEPLPEDGYSKKTGPWRDLLPLVLAILPGVAFAILVQFSEANQTLAVLPREAGLVLGLFSAVGWTWWDRSIQPQQVRRILFDPKMFRMWLTLAGVFVFKTVMERSGAINEVSKVLIDLEIPLGWMVVLLPITVGTISGLPLAFVGVTFPIVVPMINTMGALDMKLPLVLLAYVSGIAGVLLSPLHLCLILSNDYFKASWSSVYRRLWLPALIILVGGIGYFWVLRFLIG